MRAIIGLALLIGSPSLAREAWRNPEWVSPDARPDRPPGIQLWDDGPSILIEPKTRRDRDGETKLDGAIIEFRWRF